jgi:hypothetical protein
MASNRLTYRQLTEEHYRLLREHESLKGRPFDDAAHTDHERRLQAHVEALREYRRACGIGDEKR